MIRHLGVASLAALLAACAAAPQAPPPAVAPAPERAGLAHAWRDAYNACNVDALVALYHPDAVFWPTISRTLAAQPTDVRAYYQVACTAARQVNARFEIATERATGSGDLAVSAGTATVTFARQGGTVTSTMRFSLVARWNGTRWLIVEHHESLMPSPSR